VLAVLSFDPYNLRISNKNGRVIVLKKLGKQKFMPLGRSLKLSTAHHQSECFLEIRHHFIRQFFYQSEFKPISSILNIRHAISR
jgi:hypothetical protein